MACRSVKLSQYILTSITIVSSEKKRNFKIVQICPVFAGPVTYGARDRLDAIPQSIVSESSITLSLCINSYYLMLLYYSLGTGFS